MFSEISSHYEVPRPEGDLWRACTLPLLHEDRLTFEAWKDEVHHLLVFAGLFSSVVTTFIVQVYEALELTPTPSSIRVNLCWFLSLILSLITVLFGVVSLQWIRGFKRYPPNLSYKEIFARRTMHYESLDRWFVPHIFASLPLLLNLALILFFTGIVDFLLHLNLVVAIPSIVLISFAFIFLLITTTMPAIQSFWLINSSERESPPAQCPFKSPQSWAFLRLSTSWILRFIFSALGSLAFQFAIIPCTPLYMVLRWLKSEHALWNILDRLRISYQLRYLGKLRDWKTFDDFWLDERQRVATRQSADSGRYFVTGRTFVDFDAARGLAYILRSQPRQEALALATYHCFLELPASVINDGTFDLITQALPNHLKQKKTWRITFIVAVPPQSAVKNENELFLLARLPITIDCDPVNILGLRQIEVFMQNLAFLIYHRPQIREITLQNASCTPIPRLLVPVCLRSAKGLTNLPGPFCAEIEDQILAMFKFIVDTTAISREEDFSKEVISKEEILADFLQIVHAVTLKALTKPDAKDCAVRLSLLQDILQSISTIVQAQTPIEITPPPPSFSWLPTTSPRIIVPAEPPPLTWEIFNHGPNHPLFELGKLYISRTPLEFQVNIESTQIPAPAFRSVVHALHEYETKTQRPFRFQLYHPHYTNQWKSIISRLNPNGVTGAPIQVAVDVCTPSSPDPTIAHDVTLHTVQGTPRNLKAMNISAYIRKR
ncbi:hypothetical protein CPB83DRAFT_165447 [Crepidotus variabilis]|uniref:DUF6535 domain-containing protein n=1 Tax=Crepidotus variabilis TaxID=179855 RepID=A0A9P6JS92_9AGAR|nr:hypothetical protein CPB83DRAFT_165447 [Crepidotus variabilis]